MRNISDDDLKNLVDTINDIPNSPRIIYSSKKVVIGNFKLSYDSNDIDDLTDYEYWKKRDLYDLLQILLHGLVSN